MFMQLSDFIYDLPKNLIAQSPASPRDHARLMLVNRSTGSITHHHIYDLPELIPKDYSVVANNTRVFPARLFGHKSTGGKVEILLLSQLGQSMYECIVKPGMKPGTKIIFTPELGASVIKVKSYEHTLKFNQEESKLRTTLSQIGSIPTPPYIKKLLTDSSQYQTIYAKSGFSAAAPTAGLHFTPKLLDKIKKAHPWHELTLDVGLGTFLPVKAENITDHHMHAESYTIPPNLGLQNQKVLAIGTTTLRALESCPDLTPGDYSTSIFIYPPYEFQVVDALLTNFHLPGSTLLMLVSAFCSAPNSEEKFTTFATSLLGRAYHEAIANNYRFFSFGDAMLII